MCDLLIDLQPNPNCDVATAMEKVLLLPAGEFRLLGAGAPRGKGTFSPVPCAAVNQPGPACSSNTAGTCPMRFMTADWASTVDPTPIVDQVLPCSQPSSAPVLDLPAPAGIPASASTHRKALAFPTACQLEAQSQRALQCFCDCVRQRSACFTDTLAQ